MFHSSLNIPFSEWPNVLEDFTHSDINSAFHIVVGEDVTQKRIINLPGYLSFQIWQMKQGLSLSVKKGVLVSLDRQGTGVSQIM